MRTPTALARPAGMSRYAVLVLAAAVASAACASHRSGPVWSVDRLASELALLVDTLASPSASLPGALLRVEAPALDFAWTRAVGTTDLATGEPLLPGQTLRVASNTKTFVAAAILRLVEDGEIEVDASIGPLIDPASARLLEGGGYDPQQITVRMLLQHTAGLFDYASAEPFLGRIAAEPGHRWTRYEQLQIATSAGAPYGSPGEVYRYSDTGYLLLGEILETVTGNSMAKAVRELLELDRHGISHTWSETLEAVPPGALPRMHQYLGTLDTYGFHASMDLFGGGGQVSTLSDLARFYRLLLRGKVFRNAGTLATMLEMSPQSLVEGGAGYGLGIGKTEHDGLTCFGHGGFWGTLVRYCPSLHLTVAAAVTSTSARDVLVVITDVAIRHMASAIGQQGGNP